MRNLKLLALIPIVIALLAIVKLFFAGPVSMAGIGNALLDALPDMILLPFLFLLLDMARPDSVEKSES